MTNLQTFDKKNLLVGDAVISIQGDLYSLNDLHRASGGEAKHQPANFLRLDTTQKLIEEITKEISQSSDVRSALRVINGGDQRGTYVCKELVYAYAMWVSAAFNLRVIRAFDAGVSAPAAPPLPQPWPEALRLAADIEEQRLVLAAKIEADAPKVAFAERHVNADGEFSMRDTAKQINVPERKFISLLLADGYVYRSQSTNKLIPYAATIKRGYMDVRAVVITRADGTEKALQQAVVLPKGLQHFQVKYGEVAA